MPQFKYVARTSGGKLIEGVVDSNDRAAAISQIEQQRYFPIKIEPAGGTAPSRRADGATAKPRGGTAPAAATPVQTLPLTQQFLFTEQLGHLLSAGMALDEALGIMERRFKHPKLQALSASLHQALGDGPTPSQALRDYPKIFSPLYVNMVAAGEASGSLSEIMRRLVTHLSEVKALRDRVQQALVYPAVLVVAGIGLIIVFMRVMVPRLSGFFEQTGQTLPPATQMLLTINHLLGAYWWLAALVIAGLYGLQKLFTRDPAGRKTWDYSLWRIPGYGHITRYRFYAQFARTLGTLV